MLNRSHKPDSVSAVAIRLVSDDAEIERLCREVLTDFYTGKWCITTGLSEPDSESDLYIWDYYTGFSFPAAIDYTPGKHVFLVDRNSVPAFRLQVPFADSNILLKPVTPPALAAYIGFAISTKDSHLSSTKSLRAARDEMLQCVIEANLRLQEYDQDRTNFLARAVHDFRAPLTAITGYCGLLLEGSLGSLTEDQKEVLQRMQHSAQRLSRAANAMFDLSVSRHLRQDGVELQRNDLRETVEQAMYEIAPFINNKQIDVSVHLRGADIPLYFDQSQIIQVLVNILDNACKFAPRYGSIEIRGYPYFWDRRNETVQSIHGSERRSRVSREPNSYRVDIYDSGMPIRPELLPDIFEEYTTCSSNDDRSGGGLGLAICRLILTQHHGTVWAENAEGGPVFSFVLPLTPANEINAKGTTTHDPQCSLMRGHEL